MMTKNKKTEGYTCKSWAKTAPGKRRRMVGEEYNYLSKTAGHE